MARWGRRIAVASCVVVAIPVVLVCAELFSLRSSKISDFHPAQFSGKADAPFFYSIGDELKFSDGIDLSSATLFRGPIKSVLVSPDGEKIAIVSNGNLAVVDRQGPMVHKVAAVDSDLRGNPPGKDSGPIGQHYFKDHFFQWSRDSKSLYVIGDEYHGFRGGQLASDQGELWRYDLDDGKLHLVLKPFRALSYFLGVNSGIYFSSPVSGGRDGSQLKHFDGKRVTDVGTRVTDIGEENHPWISAEAFSSQHHEKPFSLIDTFGYTNEVLTSKGVRFVNESNQQRIEIKGRTYLSFKLGDSIEGKYYCSQMRDSVFLPGDRYFLTNAQNCGNYDGALLIDTVTGKYERLPVHTRVYITLNTDSYPHYSIGGFGIRFN